LLERCRGVSSIQGCEIILVDNGSYDNTPEILKDLLPNYPGCRSIRVEQNKGYGFGILSGLDAAKGQILGWTHADMQTDPIDALIGLDFFEKYPADKVFAKGLRYGRPLSDRVFTAGMSLFETILLGVRMRDINAQPTMFSRNFYNSWNDPPHDFSLDLFAYYQARRSNLSIFRFPVKFGERAYGVSHWNINWNAKKKFIKRTVEYSLNLKGRV